MNRFLSCRFILKRIENKRILTTFKEWNVNEINNELEELCGSFTSTLNNPFDSLSNNPLHSPSAITTPTITTNNNNSYNSKVNSYEIDDSDDNDDNESDNNIQTIKIRRDRNKNQKNKVQNILIISSTINSIESITNKSKINNNNYNYNINKIEWNGTVNSLLEILTNVEYDSVIMISNNKLDQVCENVLKLVQKSKKVVVLNPRTEEDKLNQNNIKYLEGFDLVDGFNTALSTFENENSDSSDSSESDSSDSSESDSSDSSESDSSDSSESNSSESESEKDSDSESESDSDSENEESNNQKEN